MTLNKLHAEFSLSLRMGIEFGISSGLGIELKPTFWATNMIAIKFTEDILRKAAYGNDRSFTFCDRTFKKLRIEIDNGYRNKHSLLLSVLRCFVPTSRR